MNVLICDDELYLRKMLDKITSKNKNIDKIFTAADGLEAIKMVKDKDINIALLDIDMPNLDGIEAAKIISKISPKTRFVFITAHMEYAIDSFSVHPYDYLLKPIDIEEFEGTLDELITLIKSQSSTEKHSSALKLAIKRGKEIIFIDVKDILYFEKVDREVLIHMNDNVYALSKTLGELKDILDKKFMRTHKSFIVNTEKIEKVKIVGDRIYQIVFIGSEKEAALSRNKYDDLIKSLSV